MRTSSIVLAIVLILTSTAIAGSGGSAYSLLGIGDLRYSSGVRSAGMGYTGIGTPSSNYLNSVDPATWARINRTRLEAGVMYEGFNSSDGTHSRYLAQVDFSGAVLAIPLYQPTGIVFAAGIAPYSNINYDTYTPGTFSSVNDTLNYAIHHSGSGGITRAFAGVSIAPLSDLALGVSLNYLFGDLENARELIPRTTAYSGGIETRTNSVSGLTFTVGGLYTGFGTVAEALKPLSLGFYVSSRGVLSAKTQSIFRYAPGLTSIETDTLAEETGSVIIPIAYGIGAAYQIGDRYIIAADYTAQQWANSEILGAPSRDMRNSTMIGLGAERMPSREGGDSWFGHIALRLGGYYNSTYYLVNGEGINEYGATAGLTVPIFSNSMLGEETRLSVAFSYGSRGKTGNGQIKDAIWRCTLTLNIGQLWFVRPEED